MSGQSTEGRVSNRDVDCLAQEHRRKLPYSHGSGALPVCGNSVKCDPAFNLSRCSLSISPCQDQERIRVQWPQQLQPPTTASRRTLARCRTLLRRLSTLRSRTRPKDSRGSNFHRELQTQRHSPRRTGLPGRRRRRLDCWHLCQPSPAGLPRERSGFRHRSHDRSEQLALRPSQTTLAVVTGRAAPRAGTTIRRISQPFRTRHWDR